MAAGAGAALIPGFDSGNPTGSFVSSMPVVIADATLVAIAIGAIAANALNIYSGAMSFLAAGVRIPFTLRRAIIAVGFGVIGFVIALIAVLDASFYSTYENFLLVIAYWIAPWLGIVFADRVLRRGTSIASFIPDGAKYRNPAGIISLVVAGGISIWLFSNQSFYEGLIARAAPIGDLTPLVGFVLAWLVYFALFAAFKPKLGGPVGTDPDTVVGVDAADAVS
jgi:NCS1 family nucleobase:cation symporter-1